MASWMIHLRVADFLLDKLKNLSPTEFIVGNIAPDSGVPNADWSAFSPSTDISHFKLPGSGVKKDLDIRSFVNKHFTPEQQLSYSREQYSFYLGYLTHLLTDISWSQKIARPTLERYPAEVAADRQGFIWKIKEDWYDLDHLYLLEHPNFRAFALYADAVDFENVYMDIFSRDAFNSRRVYITNFYLHGCSRDLDRTYPYLSKSDADRFVEDCASSILEQLSIYIQ